MIYNDAVILAFKDGSQGLFSQMPEPDRSVPAIEYIVKEGDTLYSISTMAYGDTRMWYDIAEFNFELIEDIFELTPGISLYLPVP